MSQLKDLDKSLEEGFISKTEYEKKKKEIEVMPQKKVEEKEKPKTKDVKVELKSDRTLITVAVMIILVFAIVLGSKYIVPEPPGTIDELHEFNLKGKLKPDRGYIYNSYSFVKLEDLWYTQLLSPSGSRLYDIQFRYGPREVEDIGINGKLDSKIFNDAEEYYVTFNPSGSDFSSVALAVGDFNQQMVNVFFKNPIAACDRNGTLVCVDRPIITCDSTEDMVLYVKEANSSRIYFDDNCIVIEGSGFDLLKGINRVLYDFYKII
jgi:hypothetical protein